MRAWCRLLSLALLAACAAPRERSAGERSLPERPAAAAEHPGAALHHDVRVRLDPGRRRLEVEDTVTLSPALRARLGDSAVFSLHAGLSPERVGPGAPLRRAEAAPPPADPAGGEPPRPEVPVERWTVPLARGEAGFTVRYAGELFHAVEQRGEEHERSMAESPGLVSADGAVLSGSSAWLPALDSGDELLTFALDARVPAGWEAVSQGARTRHERGAGETAARWESPEPQQEALLVAGPLVERSRQGGRVLVQTFLREDDPALAETYLSTAEQYLALYEGLLGPYPYAKFALVENFWETGLGLPSFTLLGPRIVRFPFILHTSFPHEILHDWWGNGVYVDPARGNWSEGLTAYLADHLVKEQRGEGAEYRRTSLQRYADYVAASRDFPVREFRARHSSVTQAVGYDKVLMVLHMLRRRMGDERFVAGLRAFYAAQRFRAASFDDLGRALGRAAGEELGPWLAQWLDRPGAPALRVEEVKARDDGGAHRLELTLAQTQGGPPYAVDVPVYVTLARGGPAVERSVRLASARERFTIPLDGPPARVDVDPEFDLFRRLDPAELPPALSGAFGATGAVIVLPSAAPPALRAAYAALAESWRRPGLEVVTDEALTRLPEAKAVWVLGWENRLRDTVGRALRESGAELTSGGLRAGATALTRAAHSVVVTARSPADPAQVIAFVGAADPRALPGLGRKLPHYGKYGLLGFEGAEPTNVAKQTWNVARSPLTALLGAPGAEAPRGALPPRRALAERPPSR